jgi:thiol-disulfide isomerase/thioredoxin
MSNRPNRKPSSTSRVQAAAAGGGPGPAVWIGVAVAVVLVAVLVTVIVSATGDDTVEVGGVETDEAIAYGSPRVTGDPLPEPTPAGDAAVGLPAPSVLGQTFDGRELAVDASDGRPKVLVFLAHWCPHCQAEVPRITEWLEAEGAPADVDLYGVATATSSTQGNYPPAQWLSREGWPVPTLVDDEEGTIASAFGLSGFPFFVVLDAEGTVVERASGELSTEQFAGLVDAAAAGAGTAPEGGPASPAGEG